TIEISSTTIFKIVFIILGLFLFYYILDIVVIFLLSLIIASTVRVWVKSLTKFKIPKIVAIIFIYGLTLSLMILFLSVIIGPLTQEIASFSDKIPGYYQNINDVISQYVDTESLGKISPNFSGLSADSVGQFKTLGTNIFGLLVRLFGGLTSFFSVVIISFYLAFEETGIEKVLRILTPLKYEDYVLDLWFKTELKFSRWLSSQLILGLVIGISIYIGLTLMGIPYPLLLAIVAGLLEIVPFVGPIISAITGILIAFSVSAKIGLITTAFYLIINQIENNIIIPLLMKKVIGLHPVVIIIVLMIGFKLYGIMGMIIAVPLTTVLDQLIKDLADKKQISF
ncbi:AI-2E family transporter, partial [Candidatus Azambacteria bacterium]|nr:AI-2E family transporter [Candidatus Azambacteria bacterium]